MIKRLIPLVVLISVLSLSSANAKSDLVRTIDERVKGYKLSEGSKERAIEELKAHTLSFAHLERKAALYGLAQNLYYSIDDSWAKLPDMKFFNALMQVFAKQMDSHTRFYYPDYMSCRRASIPIEFRFYRDTADEDSWGKVVVYDIKDKKKFKSVYVGDELAQIEDLKINQKNFDNLRKFNAQSKRGFYESVAHYFLSHIDGRYSPMPGRDKVYLLFRDHKSKEMYDMEVPWEYDYSKCKKADLYKDLKFPDKKDEHKNKFVFRSERYSFEKIKNPDGLTDELYEAGIVSRNGIKGAAKYGYLKVKTFKTFEDEGKEETINEFIDRTLISMAKLMHVFADNRVKGLIIDMRYNPGGWIELAHHMARVFSKKPVKSVLMQFANGELSLQHLRDEREEAQKERKKIEKRDIWSSFPYTPKFFNWDSYEEAIESTLGKPLRLAPLRPHFIRPADSLNPLDDGKDFPKVLLVDQYCVSSCDVFASMFKSNGIGKVIGQRTRGAGGMVHSGKVEVEGRLNGKKKYDAKILFRYAYTNILGSEMQIIEDVGVYPDVHYQDHISQFWKGEGDGSWVSKAISVFNSKPGKK